MEARLCSGFKKSDWPALERRLKKGDEDAWVEAIDVFERRINERFFSCIDVLIAADSKLDGSLPGKAQAGACFPGFSMMALCCLLVETLQSFRDGPSNWTPGKTMANFKLFLRRPAFGEAFDEEIIRKFVNGLRNGILHDAETRRWVIRRDKPKGKIVEQLDGGLALNRTLFYEAVKKEFKSYLTELRKSSTTGPRERFRKKMQGHRRPDIVRHAVPRLTAISRVAHALGKRSEMRIACLGWGSLIWDPRDLPVRRGWFNDGPVVPVEFSRKSSDGRVTLVIDVSATPLRVLWAQMVTVELDEAAKALCDREGVTNQKWVGRWKRGEDAPKDIPGLPAWAEAREVAAVVWTALGPNFTGEHKSSPVGDVISYLRSLQGSIRAHAKRYIEQAPRQIDTDYRRKIEAELGWCCSDAL
jgi:hypothetical protein